MRRLLPLLLCLVLFLSAASAEGPALPLDYLQGGKPPRDEGWTFEYKKPVSYEDSTISVTFEKQVFYHRLTAGKYRGRKPQDEAWVVRIRIGDVSQLRTAVSFDTYEGRSQEDAAVMANKKNAVVAINGDFCKYEYDVGYLVRQGELIRDETGNRRGRIFDMLVIDSEGDFHAVENAATDRIRAFIEKELTPRGRTILDTFNIGPVLVLNGEVQDVSQTEMARQGSYEWPYCIERIAVVQTGELEYAIVTVGTKSKTSGLAMQEFAEFVAEKVPDAILAYNLDGGGSANLTSTIRKTKRDGSTYLEHVRINRNNDIRDITDILYFASAED